MLDETATEIFDLNGDLAGEAFQDSEAMDWSPSPRAGVWRKRLEHAGTAEAGRVTSLVRFDGGAKFTRHDHPGGEEIFVLDGTFSDDSGDYGAGSYVFNPEGFSHAPWSQEGCTLFVRLRHHAGASERISIGEEEGVWMQRREGVLVKMLFQSDDRDDASYLVQIDAGVQIPFHDHPQGEEVFVVDGSIRDEHGEYGPGCWKRFAAGSSHAPISDEGCLLYVRTGYVPQ